MIDIKGYENLYAVTKNGDIWSYPKTNKYTRHLKGNFLKKVLDNGYLYVSLHKNGKQKKISVHKLVAQSYLLNPNNLPQVNHKNGIKTDNRAENLEWVTAKQNTQHAWDNGLIKVTEKMRNIAKLKIQKWNLSEQAKVHHSKAGLINRKLSKEQILNIMELQKKGQSAYSVAKIFNVSKQTILKIYRKENYKEFVI